MLCTSILFPYKNENVNLSTIQYSEYWVDKLYVFSFMSLEIYRICATLCEFYMIGKFEDFFHTQNLYKYERKLKVWLENKLLQPLMKKFFC